jgi:hypothetical protein
MPDHRVIRYGQDEVKCTRCGRVWSADDTEPEICVEESSPPEDHPDDPGPQMAVSGFAQIDLFDPPQAESSEDLSATEFFQAKIYAIGHMKTLLSLPVIRAEQSLYLASLIRFCALGLQDLADYSDLQSPALLDGETTDALRASSAALLQATDLYFSKAMQVFENPRYATPAKELNDDISRGFAHLLAWVNRLQYTPTPCPTHTPGNFPGSQTKSIAGAIHNAALTLGASLRNRACVESLPVSA